MNKGPLRELHSTDIKELKAQARVSVVSLQAPRSISGKRGEYFILKRFLVLIATYFLASNRSFSPIAPTFV